MFSEDVQTDGETEFKGQLWGETNVSVATVHGISLRTIILILWHHLLYGASPRRSEYCCQVRVDAPLWRQGTDEEHGTSVTHIALVEEQIRSAFSGGDAARRGSFLFGLHVRDHKTSVCRP